MLTRIENRDLTTAEVETDLARPIGRRKPVAIAGLAFRFILQVVLMTVVLAAAFFAMQYLIEAKEEPSSRPPFKTVYAVDAVVAEAADNRPGLVAYGETVAARSVELRTLVSGEIVSVSPRLVPGGRINDQDPLITIDRFQYEGALREAEANQAEAASRITEIEARIATEHGKIEHYQRQLELALTDLERANALLTQGTFNQKQVDERSIIVSQRRQILEQTENAIVAEGARIKQQSAGLVRLQWRVEQARRNLADTVLKAPFDGVINTYRAETGKMVTANDIVIEMFDDRQLDVRFTLSDSRYGQLQGGEEKLIGRAVKVIWSVGTRSYEFDGKVSRLGAVIDTSRGGITLYARLDTSKTATTIRPGAFVEVELPGRLYAHSFRVPDIAVYQGDRVYVIEDGLLVERMVEILTYDGADAIISDGIASGDKVLTTRIAEVSPGLKVRTADQPAAPQDATAKVTGG